LYARGAAAAAEVSLVGFFFLRKNHASPAMIAIPATAPMTIPAIGPPPKLEESLPSGFDVGDVDADDTVTDWLSETIGTVNVAVVEEDAAPDVVAVLDALEDEDPRAAICEGIRSRFT
jgi:hypothetical protein